MPTHQELFRFVTVRAPRRQPKPPTDSLCPTHPDDAEPSPFFAGLKQSIADGNIAQLGAAARAFVGSETYVRGAESLRFQVPGVDPQRLPAIAGDRLVQVAARVSGKRAVRVLAELAQDRGRLADSLLAAVLVRDPTLGPRELSRLSRLLRTWNLLLTALERRVEGIPLTQPELDALLAAPICLPDEVFSIDGCWPRGSLLPDGGSVEGLPAKALDRQCTEPDPCCARIRPFVADLMVVRQELRCYEAAEVANIENVLKGEERTRTHRHLRRREEERVVEIANKRLQERDHQVAEAFSLSRSTSATLDEESAQEIGVTATAKYGKNLTVVADFGASQSSSLTESHNIATEFARDVTQRSKNRLEESFRERTSVRSLEETEEKNRHKLSNLEGTEASVGIFHWVNEVHKAQVMSYGQRLTLDLVVPEPAKFYRYQRDLQHAAAVGEVDPEPLPQIDPAEISDDPTSPTFYLDLAAQFGLSDLDPPPPASTVISTSGQYYNQAGDTNLTTLTEGDGLRLHKFDTPLKVPQGYGAASLTANGVLEWGDGTKDVAVVVGSAKVDTGGANSTFGTSPMQGDQGTLDVQAQSWGVTAFSLSVLVRCDRLEGTFRDWQISVYEAILGAHARDLRRLEQAEQTREDLETRRFRVRPFRYRGIERRELQRMATSMISCQYFDDFDAMKPCVKPCGFPQMSLSEAEAEGRVIRFFEQAFEWPQMTYVFYPYSWSNKCTWPERLAESSDDLLFEQFLFAGAARVQVTVRPGFEELVLFFLETGVIWGGEEAPPQVGSSYYLAMVDEIREQQRSGLTFREGTLAVGQGEISAAVSEDAELHPTDVDREILIDCETYRLVEILEGEEGKLTSILLDRPFEGPSSEQQKFAIGALFVGSPWKVRVPTELVYVPNDSVCLPKYPLPPCPPPVLEEGDSPEGEVQEAGS